jgi:hypothetical protein
MKISRKYVQNVRKVENVNKDEIKCIYYLIKMKCLMEKIILLSYCEV